MNVIKNRLTPKYDILRSFMPLVKQRHFNYVGDDDKLFKIAFKCYNGFLRCANKSVELIYITFLHSGMSTLGIFPADLNPVIFFFRWHDRTKINHIYHRLFK